MMEHLPSRCQQIAEQREREARIHGGCDGSPYDISGHIELMRVLAPAIRRSTLFPSVLVRGGFDTRRGLEDEHRIKERSWQQTLREGVGFNFRGALFQDERQRGSTCRVVEEIRLDDADEPRLQVIEFGRENSFWLPPDIWRSIGGALQPKGRERKRDLKQVH